jgi:ATP diphosphatase
MDDRIENPVLQELHSSNERLAKLPPHGLDRLVAIMAQLRNRDGGCPWDLEQDFASIAPYTIEEAFEVADAIRRGDMVDLRDELGDLLLQVVYHARMAEEAGQFALDAVIEGISAKLIRRHPHVFGSKDAREAENVKPLWQAIKAQEKAERQQSRLAAGLSDDSPRGLLGEVKSALPALQRALKLQQKAASVGFDWNDAARVVDKLEEETLEIRDALAGGQQSAIADEIGDLFFVLVNLARHAGVDPETTLQQANDKFARRFSAVEDALLARGQDWAETSLGELEALWVAVKQRERPEP